MESEQINYDYKKEVEANFQWNWILKRQHTQSRQVQKGKKTRKNSSRTALVNHDGNSLEWEHRTYEYSLENTGIANVVLLFFMRNTVPVSSL